MFQKVIKQQHYPFYVLGWAAVITLVSSIPNLQIESVANIPKFDKYVHVIIFGILTYLLSGALQGWIKTWKDSKQILIVLVFVLLFGLIDELHQSTVTGRTCSWRDLVADGIGGVIGAYLYCYLQNKAEKGQESSK